MPKILPKGLRKSEMVVIDFFLRNDNKPLWVKEISKNIGFSEPTTKTACENLRERKRLEVSWRKLPKERRKGVRKTKYYSLSKAPSVVLFLIDIYGKIGFENLLASGYYQEILTDDFLNECITRLAIRWLLNPEMKEKIRTLQSETIERELKSHKKKRPEIELGKSNEFISIILKSNNVSECMDRLKSRGFGLKKGENPLSYILDDQDIQAFKIISKCSPSTLKASFEDNPLPFPPYYKIMFPPKRFFIIIFGGLMRYLFGLYFQYDMTTTHGTIKAYEKLSKGEHQLLKMFLD
jgi:hypothetical protein